MTTTAPRRVRFGPALAAVYTGQLARAKVARVSLLFAATLQSVGILLLLRGVVDNSSDVTKEQVVAGATVLVVAFVGVNLLAQRFGALLASGGLGYYAALPVPPAAVVIGTAASFASFTAPGALATAVLGCALYGLPFAHLWVLAPVLVLGGAALAGLGAVIGLTAPRPELATVLGQLAMSLVLFLGLIPAARLPGLLRALLVVVPSTYAVRALVIALRSPFRPGAAVGDLLVCAGVAVVSLTLATWAFRRAVRR